MYHAYACEVQKLMMTLFSKCAFGRSAGIFIHHSPSVFISPLRIRFPMFLPHSLDAGSS